MSLSEKNCVPCEGGVQPLTSPAAHDMLKNVPNWELSGDSKSITRYFTFKDFAEALVFTNKIGEIAEAENHHPDIGLGWGYVDVVLMTHDIDGLHENDFIMAAKIDKIAAG